MSIPVPVLDDRSFEQLIAETVARIPVHTPEWTNRNDSDPGITIVQLFAFLTENLLYRSNRIPEANRLKFLSMLGISLRPASPGVGLVTFQNDRAPLTPPLDIPAATVVQAGKVPFVTRNELPVLPVTSAAYYKKPQTGLDDVRRQAYERLYQTFLGSPTDVLSFYQPVALDPPVTGKPDPVVDLGDSDNGTIDRSVWIALLAPKGADLAAVRAAIANQTISIGVYPAARVLGQRLLPATTGGPTVDPGLVFEIAAPQPDPSGLAGPGYGIGPANYTRLPVSYADSVLQAPGIVQVTLPPYDALLLWAFDPEEEGTGDFPPRVDDAAVTTRLVSWIRVRYPPLPGTAAPDAATPDAAPGAGPGPTALTASTPAAPCLPAGGSTSLVLSGDACELPPGRLTWVGVNAATVVQAVPVTNEIVGAGTGTPFQTFKVANTPVIVDQPGATFVIEVLQPDGVTWSPWYRIDDIYAAPPDGECYMLDPASGQVTGGSGLFGARWPLGAKVRATYEYGGGLQGQVPVGAITKSTLPGGYSVRNPVATWGADPGESVADGEASISRWLRHRDRLVTIEDFADVTRRTPGIDLGRVEVMPLFNPDGPDPQQRWPGMVTVLVIPRSDPVNPSWPLPDRQFLNAVCAWLEPRRLITTELHVRGPVYRQIWVSVGIETLPGQVPSLVRQQVVAAVERYLSPLVGGLAGAAGGGDVCAPTERGGWPLGADVRSHDIEAVATRVAGVRYVDSVRLAALDPSGTLVTGIDSVPITGLQLPAATVFATLGPAEDPASLIGSSQPVLPTQVPVPVVPPTC